MSKKWQKRLDVERGHDLNQRRRKGQLVDVCFRVGDRDFPAHRVIVSLYSPYLRAIACRDTSFFSEARSDVIVLREVDPRCFDLLLDYLYTGSIVLDQGNVHGLIETCQYLQLDDGLSLACIAFLAEHVAVCSLEELLKSWNVAERFGFRDLKSAIMRVLEYRLDHFMAKEVFSFLGLEEMREILSHPALCLRNEKVLFDNVLEWGKNNVEDDGSVDLLTELVSLVKLAVLHPQYVKGALSTVDRGLLSSGRQNLQNSMKARDSHVRGCGNCFFVFQYAKDGSDVLGIEEFVSQRKEEPMYAMFQPHMPSDGCLSVLPSLTHGKSYFQHYGPHSTTLAQLLSTETTLMAIGGVKMASKSQRLLSEEIKLFDLESNSWQQSVRNALPVAVIDFGAVYHRDGLYLIGGLTDQQQQQSPVRVTTDYWNHPLYVSTRLYYHAADTRLQPPMSRGTWRVLAEMPAARVHFSVERVGDIIFVVGDSFCDAYDIARDSWTQLQGVPPQGFGRRPGLAAVGTSLFVLGNRPGQGNNVCCCLDVTSLTWREVANPRLRQDVLSAFSHNNLVYLLGWQKSGRNMIHSYDPVLGQWTTVAKHVGGTIRPGVLVRRQMVAKSFFFGKEDLIGTSSIA